MIVYTAIYATMACGLYGCYCWRRDLLSEFPEIEISNPADLLLAVPLLGVFLALRYISETYISPMVCNRIKKIDPENYEVKKEKTTKECFHCLWYTFTTFMTLQFFYGTEYLPNLLMGSRDFTKIFEDYPYGKQPIYVKVYFMVQLAFHTYDAISMEILTRMKGKKGKDYNELMIHHLITLGMIILAYLCSFYPLGITVLFCAHSSDAALYFCKVCRDTQILNTRVLDCYFVAMFGFWAYVRGFAMTYYSAYLCSALFWFDVAFKDQAYLLQVNKAVEMAQRKGYAPYILVKFILLSLLALLNYYWLYLMWSIFANRLFKGDKSFAIKNHGETGAIVPQTEQINTSPAAVPCRSSTFTSRQ